MTAVLRRLSYVYKKPRLVPDAVKLEVQELFVKNYKKLNKNKDKVVLFMDAIHPQYQPISAHSWIRCGQEMPVKTNNSRKRLNIHGAIEINSLTPVIRFENTVNTSSTIKLLDKIEDTFPHAKSITIICDNATYYRAKAVKEHIKDSRIKLLFIPACSPNLNLIEWLWKFFKKQILYNKYYSCFGMYEDACHDFFQNLDWWAVQLRPLLTENFEIIRHY
ncbi:IS630 family transposase [Thiospirillum jenense]|uniref:IS630 family transposase n=1 Tax=Thiospirillum jenense TaxID=1653858 RepID=UPI0030B805D4